MRIGILTFHRPINYGAFLQAFSLSARIKQLMPDSRVEIVDYIAPKEKNKIIINVLWGIKHFGVVNGIRDIEKIKAFHSVYGCLPLSKKVDFTNLDKLYEYIDNAYDLLIIGSDAVFNWNQNGYPTAFIPDYNFNHCRIATYAASVHGLKFYDEPAERIKACSKAFEKQSFIGVRDKNTENFVKYCLPKAETTHCCDPTLFIDLAAVERNAGDYQRRIHDKYKVDFKRKYIVIMAEEYELIRAIRERYGGDYQILSLFLNNSCADKYLYDLNPFEWVMLLKGADAVVTNYFHGTLLSLICGTPVYSIDRSGYSSRWYESKLKDLMHERLKLSDFLLDSSLAHAVPESGFFAHFDKSLSGDYEDRIKEAVSNEQKAFGQFNDFLLNLNL